MAKGFGNMQGLMQQAQAMQKKLAKMQEEMAVKEITGTSGGNSVSVVVNGKQEVLSIKIDPSVLQANDVEMLQDLVLTAVNDALNRSRTMTEQAMSSITGGMNIPGLF